MYRHLYRNPTLLSRLLIKEYSNLKIEEYGYRYAALSKLREEQLIPDELQQLETFEHWEIAKASMLPQIFTILNNLHKATRNQPILKYPEIEAVNRMTALIDPNMFPIQDLQEKMHTEDAISVWKSGNKQVKQKIGFWLNVKPSSINHIEAGDGVFLQTSEQGKSLPPGTLLGFVPGVIYDHYQDYSSTSPPDMHFFRYDGAIIDFEEKLYHPYQPGYCIADYQQKILELTELAARCSIPQRQKVNAGFELIRGDVLNPYAVGHIINHTPKDQSTNVCLIDLFVPQQFFPYELMKFWPSFNESNEKDSFNISVPTSFFQQAYPKKKFFRGLGIISVDTIKDGQELYMDYLESCLFDMEMEVPDWLIKPPPMHPQICKSNFSTKPNLLSALLEDYAFKRTKDGQNYDKFVSKVLREKQYL